MTTLLYHASDADTSPFDEAVLRVARRNAIKIVSPYIGLNYLQRLIDVSTDWTLMSDIEAWLSSLSISERVRVVTFIHANLEKIHHYSAIHAKTVISSKLAYLGSANLTRTGILNRTEMGVLLEDIQLVQELNAWFDDLWTQTTPPDITEITQFVEWLDQQTPAKTAVPPKKSLSFNGKKVHAHLSKLDDLKGTPSHHVTTELVEQPHGKAKKVALGIIDIYDPDSMTALVDTLVAEGFSFRTFVQAVHRQTANRESQRNLYFALLPFCANHPRSVFAPETINRILFIDGIFVQSTSIQLDQQQIRYDDYLSNLIFSLSFNDALELPNSTQFGLRKIHQHQLVDGLVESGLLRQIKNIKESSTLYTLEKNFKWSGRFQLFKNSYKNWNKILNRLQSITPPCSPNITLTPASPSPSITTKTQATTSVENRYSTEQPTITDKTPLNSPEISNQARKRDAPPAKSNLDAIKPTPNFISSNSASSLAKPVRVIIKPDLESFKKEESPIAARIDELNLNIAKIIEPTSGFFNFKSIKDFANYIYAHYKEEKKFIEQTLLEKKLFDVSINLARKTTACAVNLNKSANMDDYPKTYKFMLETASFRNKNSSSQGNSRIGFFAKTIGHRALLDWEKEKIKITRKKENELNKKALTSKNFNKEKATLEAIKKLYQKAEHSDQVFESLIFYIQLYGNPIPLASATEVFEKISTKTNLEPEYIKGIFDNKINPFVLSIIKNDINDNFCHVSLKNSHAGNFETLPRTKKLLENTQLDQIKTD